jgi:hypothetical protein
MIQTSATTVIGQFIYTERIRFIARFNLPSLFRSPRTLSSPIELYLTAASTLYYDRPTFLICQRLEPAKAELGEVQESGRVHP